MEENNAGAPTRIFPRTEDGCDARDRLRKRYGGGGSHVSAESQAVGDLEKRVARQRRPGFSGQGCAAAKQNSMPIGSLSWNVRAASRRWKSIFLKKGVAAFQKTSSASRRQRRHRLYEQIQEAGEAGAIVNRLCRAAGVSRAGSRTNSNRR